MHPGFTRKDVIKKIKRAFHKLNLSPNRRGGVNYLLVMNVPPLMGRRDAAYLCMFDLFKTDIFSLSESDRCNLYKKSLELISIIIETTAEIATASREFKNEREQRMSSHFSLLYDLVEAALALVEPVVILQSDENSIHKILGNKSSDQIRQLEDVLNESEINIVQTLKDFIEISQAQLIIDRQVSFKSLPRQNQERYTNSFKEFHNCYNHFADAEPQ